MCDAREFAKGIVTKEYNFAMEYSSFEALVKMVYRGVNDYSFITDEESQNDTTHAFWIEKDSETTEDDIDLIHNLC